MQVTFYKRPHGRTEEINMTKIRPEDEAWFKSVGAKLSMEDIGGGYACYADVGVKDEDGEPLEAIEIATGGQSCEDTMQKLRKQCELLLEGEQE